MANSPELTVLFAKLASQIQTGNVETSNNDQSDDVLVSALNQSLNLSELPRVRVLDTALSLMCFTAPQVFDSIIDYSVNTIELVLSSSTDCKVLRFNKAEVLRIGSSISSHDCKGVIESCADVLGKLDEHGTYSRSLLYAVVRLAVMTTKIRYTTQLTPVLNVQPTDEINNAISKLMHYIPKRTSLENQELQTRLQLWYFDPQNLVKDVSEILQDVIGRPFVCLTEELYENMEWRLIIICLSLSPLMFIETRALLHRWFLLTGLDSVLELEVELVSGVLDLISRPMRWGLSAEVGLKLPFSYAYFLFKHQLFRSLAGPMSFDGFLELVHRIKKFVSHTKKKLKHFATKTSLVDHKSAWAMAINFPNWFYFAALLLSGKTISDSYICRENKDEQLLTSSSSAVASWYIAWILDPVDESASGILAKKFETLSRIMKPKVNDKTYHKYTGQSQTIRFWLEEFEKIGIKNNAMFRRITFGFIIGCFDSINEEECELFLHHVATGTIIWSNKSQHVGFKHKKSNYESIDKCSRKESISGAITVFNLTDIAEKMSDSIFETREVALNFICKIKVKVVKYLVKCVKRVLEFEYNQNHDYMLIKDLHKRLLQWKHQGNDVLHGYKDFDDIINVIVSKLI